jgi:hypothetical protein
MDIGMSPILVIPRDLRMVGDVLVVVDVILESQREDYASSHSPRD